MGLLDKLPLALSSLAVANSVAIPFVLNNETPEVIEAPKEEPVSTTTVVTVIPKRAKMKKQPTERWKDAMKYLNCVGDTEGEEREAKKISCRENFWFWD